MRLTKAKKQLFDRAVFGKDDHGEYLEVDTMIGKIRDYSPWEIADYKTYKGINN